MSELYITKKLHSDCAAQNNIFVENIIYQKDYYYQIHHQE